MTIDEAGAAVHVGETVIRFADDGYITPGEARKLAEALTELADWAEGGDAGERTTQTRAAPRSSHPGRAFVVLGQ